MKREFEPGDRVAVYSGAYRYVGVVKSVSYEGLCQVMVGDHPTMMFYHSKQLRRLKPKRERRRVWVEIGVGGKALRVNVVPTRSADSDWVEFIEVRKPKEPGR